MRTRQHLAIAIVGVARAAAARPAPAAVTSTAAPTASDAPWQLAVEPRLGVVIPTSKLGPMVLGGLQVDVATPVADHRLLVGIDAWITRPGHDGVVMDPRLSAPASYTVDEREIVVALLASYRFAGSRAAFVPWVAAGPMLSFLHSSETTSAAPGENTASSTEAGAELGGGAELAAGPGYVGAELRVVYAKLDHDLTGSSNAGSVALSFAYRLIF